MTSFELITKLATSKAGFKQAIEICVEAGNKDVYISYCKELGIKAKEYNQAWKDASPTKAKASSFASVYYAWLASAPRTEAEMEGYILADENSDNVKKNLPHYRGIWNLVTQVRKDMEEAGEPSEIDLAWMNLKAEMKKARPVKSKVHPDRVSHLNDEALTKAYAEAFKKLNTKK